MKLTLVLLALVPLVFGARIRRVTFNDLTEEQKRSIGFDNLTEEQKRFLLDSFPSLSTVEAGICAVLNSGVAHSTCESACQVALASIPYGSLAGSMCPTACAYLTC